MGHEVLIRAGEGKLHPGQDPLEGLEQVVMGPDFCLW